MLSLGFWFSQELEPSALGRESLLEFGLDVLALDESHSQSHQGPTLPVPSAGKAQLFPKLPLCLPESADPEICKIWEEIMKVVLSLPPA